MTRILPALSLTAAIATLLVATSGPDAAPTQAQQCLAAKEKMLGKYESCVWKAYAKSTQTGAPLDTALCQSKLEESWTKPDAKYGADCPDASAATIVSLFGEHVSEVLAAMGGTSASCGNGTVDPGEDCDGTTSATCSGLGYGNGGTVACSACQHDTSGCSGCSVFAQDCPNGADSCSASGAGATACGPPGTGTEGQECQMSGSGCVESNICVTTDGTNYACRQYCQVSDPASCPSGYGCGALQDYDDIGACIPI